MNVIVAMDSFKGSMSAIEAVEAVRAGLTDASPLFHVDALPVADGGEGFAHAMCAAAHGRICTARVHNHRGALINAEYALLPDGSAAIEMAAAAGLTLTPERDVLHASTYGVGELILAALDSGCTRLIVGLGGSATNDGGLGMLRALGGCFTAEDGREITCAAELPLICECDLSRLDSRLSQISGLAACDVDNPLCGETGASAIFGPQKGANPEQVALLDAGLASLARALRAHGLDMEGAGSGAAGGLGGALKALGFGLQAGIEIVLVASSARERIARAELAIVGEGMTDYQTASGKAPCGIARLCAELEVPVVCISGGLGRDYQQIYECGVTAAFSAVNRPMALSEAMERAYELLRQRTRDIARLWLAASKARN